MAKPTLSDYFRAGLLTSMEGADPAATEPRELSVVLDELGEATEKAESLASRLEDGSISSEDQKAIKDELESLSGTVNDLKTEKEQRLVEEERSSMREQVKSLTELVEELRKPGEGFEFAGGVPTATGGEENAWAEKSFYADVRRAQKGDAEARKAIYEAAGGEERHKAMVEGTDSAGGYLVAPQVSDELVRLKYYRTPLRNLFSTLNVTSDTLQIAQQTGGLTAAWTDELATKTAADFTFGQISVSVFTAAGLAVVSNQLLQDANPSIDGLINSDLARRLATLEEVAFINGSGTGQPRGILNTSGVNSVTYTDATPTAGETLDYIVDAIAKTQDEGKTEPTDIVLHPKIWTRLIKSRESDGHYTIEASYNSRSPQSSLPVRTLFGLPVTLSYNVPTNLGAGTNESRIIVGDFKQGLILDRQGVVIDDSSHVYFTTNQTVFRGESRVGFTAGRDPKAFTVIGGTGLIQA